MSSLNTRLNNIVARLNSQQQQMTAMAQELRSARDENRQLKERLHQQEKDMKEVIGNISEVKKDIKKDIKDVKDDMARARDDIESLEHSGDYASKQIYGLKCTMVQKFYVPTETFELFPKLPPEIRRQIWKSDAFSRIIEVHSEEMDSLYVYQPAFPVLFQICSESRKLAFELHTNLLNNHCLNVEESDEYAKHLSSMFQPAIDTILLGVPMFEFSTITVLNDPDIAGDTDCWWKGSKCWPLVEMDDVQSLAITLQGFSFDSSPFYTPHSNKEFPNRHNHLFLPQLSSLKEIIFLLPENDFDGDDDWQTDGQEPPVHKWIGEGMEMWKTPRPIYKVMTVDSFRDPNRNSDSGIWTPEKHADCPYCKLRDNSIPAKQGLEGRNMSTSTENEGTGDGVLETLNGEA